MASPLLLLLLLLLLFLLPFSSTQPLSPSQSETLLQMRSILEFPPSLSSWSVYTPFCYLPNTTSVFLSCSSSNLMSLTIIGNRTRFPRNPLSANFSIDSLFATLARLPTLRSLTLSNLGLWGPLPGKLDQLQELQILNLSSNYLYGSLPSELTRLGSLQRLDLGGNFLKGNVPDLSNMSQLEEVELGFNKLGPELPVLGQGVVRLVLRNNTFKSNLPPGFRELRKLEWLDVANNRLLGPVPAYLFGLPGIRRLDLSGNSLTGALPRDLQCSGVLDYVDLSRNKLVGSLPTCILKANAMVKYSWNCLTGVDTRLQHPNSYCNEKPFAAVLPRGKKEGSRAKNGLALMLGVAGGIIGGALLLALVLFVVMRKVKRDVKDGEAVVLGRSPSRGVKDAVPADARRMCTDARVGMLDLKPYRMFTVSEIEEMTNNFDPSMLVKETAELQIYRGRLDDGSMVAVRCLNIRQKYSSPSMQKFTDTISKLRHRNLVSILGHCIESAGEHLLDTSSIYLVFELVSNGTLRSHLTEWRKREMLKWPQRITAIIGVARGIQFLHNGAAPGIFGNDLTIDNILLDKTLAAKIDNYNLPKIMLSKDKNNKVGGDVAFNALDGKYVNSAYGVQHGDKEDIYKLGLILLEVITGKPPTTSGELETSKLQLQRIVSESSPSNLADLIDPAIQGTFAFDSLRTAMEVTLSCLRNDPSQRPSIDDVLWNLQYSVQIQNALATAEDLSGQF